MCEDGEIEADGRTQQIVIRRHVSNQAETFDERTINIRTNGSGHGGGDDGIMEDFAGVLTSTDSNSRSSISRSVESHLMAFAIEKSRLTGTVVDMEAFKHAL